MRRVLTISAALLCLCAQNPVAHAQIAPAGQGQPARQFDPFGFDFMQFMFKQSGLQPIDLGNASRRPSETVFVYLGQTSSPKQQRIYNFLNRGGSVLFATDQGSDAAIFSTTRAPHRVRGDEYRYQGYDDCLRVPVEEHEITAGVKEVIVNRSGAIQSMYSGFWRSLATLPESNLDLLAVRDHENTRSRIVLMADHSPFTNDMLMHGDNAILAVNIINYLSEGNRKYICFLVDDRSANSSISPMLPPDEIPPIDPDDIPADTKMAIANRFLKEVERENALNRFLDSIPSRIIWRWLIIIGTILLAVYLFRRLLASRSIIEPPAMHAANSSEARSAAMLRSKSLYPAAQELARDFLRTLIGDDANKPFSVHRREVWVSASVGSPRKIQVEVEKLGHIASGSDRRRVKPKQLRKLAARIEELRGLVSNGQLRLQPSAATT